eukprot:tig00000042_g15472.t1
MKKPSAAVIAAGAVAAVAAFAVIRSLRKPAKKSSKAAEPAVKASQPAQPKAAEQAAPVQAPAAKKRDEWVKQEIAKHPVMLFSRKVGCRFCTKLKDLLKSLGAAFEVCDMDEVEDGPEIHAALIAQTNWKTVPCLFIGGKLIGGCDDAHKLHEQGKLVDAIRAAGGKVAASAAPAPAPAPVPAAAPAAAPASKRDEWVGCRFCTKLKDLLKSLGAAFEVCDMDEVEDGPEIHAALIAQTNWKTVPCLFIGGKLIGGCDDAHKLHEQGKLVDAIRAAGGKPADDDVATPVTAALATVVEAVEKAASAGSTPAGTPSKAAAPESGRAAWVKEQIAKHPVMLFSRSVGCRFCTKLKGLLKSLNIPFEACEMDLEEDGPEIHAALVAQTSWKTVPCLFIGGKLIGGCDDAHKLHDEGKLVPAVKATGAKL